MVNNAEVLGSLRDLGTALGLRVRPYTVTNAAPFASYVATMAKTGVLVARHNPLLGAAIFLPPGAAMNWRCLGSGLALACRESWGLGACMLLPAARQLCCAVLHPPVCPPLAAALPSRPAAPAAPPGYAGALVLELLPYNWEWKGLSEIYLNLTRSLGGIHHFAWRATSAQWAVYADPDDAKYSHWTIEECSSKWVQFRTAEAAAVSAVLEGVCRAGPWAGMAAASLAAPSAAGLN